MHLWNEKQNKIKIRFSSTASFLISSFFFLPFICSFSSFLFASFCTFEEDEKRRKKNNEIIIKCNGNHRIGFAAYCFVFSSGKNSSVFMVRSSFFFALSKCWMQFCALHGSGILICFTELFDNLISSWKHNFIGMCI